MRFVFFALWLFLTLGTEADPRASAYNEPGEYGFAYRVEDIPDICGTMESSRIYYPDSAGSIPGSAVPCPIAVLGHGFMME